AQAQITKNETVSHGYAAGLEKLAGHEEIIKRAEKASKDYKANSLPDEVTKAYNKAKEKLDEYAKVGPEFQVTLYKNELAAAVESGREKADSAVKSLKEISKSISEATGTQTALKGSVQKEFDAVKKLLKEIKED